MGRDGKPAWLRIAQLKEKRDRNINAEIIASPQDRAAVKTAVGTIVIAAFTVVLALVGWYQLKVIRGQLEEMKTASSLTKEQLDLLVIDQRPWVTVDMDIVSPLILNSNNGGVIGIRFKLKNTGRSPATKIQIFSRIYLLGGDPTTQKDNPMEEQLAYCGNRPKRIDPQEKAMSLFGHTLFPGDSLVTGPNFFNVSPKDISDYHAYFNKTYSVNEASIWIRPVLIGCVYYGFPFNDERHQSGFIRKIIHLMPSMPALST